MKRSIFLALSLMLIAQGTWAADTSIIGSIWKQEDATGLPADDIAIVDFSNVSTVGLPAGVSGEFVSYTTPAGSTYANVTTDIKIQGKSINGPKAEADGAYAAALGGYSSISNGNYAVNAGGFRNSISSLGTYAGILGGNQNSIIGSYGFIGAGIINSISGTHCGILSGYDNTCSGNYGVTLGGYNNDVTNTDSVVIGGRNNVASGNTASVLGGRNNTAGGDYSIVGGRQGILSTAADRTTAFIYGESAVNITTPDVFLVYGAAGFEKNAGFQTLTPHSRMTVNGSLAMAFNHYSSGNSPIDLTVDHMSVNCDAGSGNVTFNLVSSVNIIGRGYEITITDDGSGANKCYIDPAGSETLNGFTTYSGLDTTGESVLIRATSGSTWDWTIKGGW